MKARFMNLVPTLNWASAILWHLDHPESRSRQGIKPCRMTEKLGWLRDFARASNGGKSVKRSFPLR